MIAVSSCRVALCAMMGLGWRAALHAQAPAASPTPEPVVEMDIRFFALHRRNIENIYLREAPGVYAPIHIRSRTRSAAHAYRGPRELRILKRIDVPGEEAFQYQTVASVTLPDDSDEALVFLLPPGFARGEQWRERWMIGAIDDGPASFPRGHVRVLNATGLHLEGVVGDFPIAMNFGITRPLSLGNSREWTRVAFTIPVGNRRELVYGNRIRFENSDRAILVLRPPRRRRSLQIDTYLLEDTPPPPEPENGEDGER